MLYVDLSSLHYTSKCFNHWWHNFIQRDVPELAPPCRPCRPVEQSDPRVDRTDAHVHVGSKFSSDDRWWAWHLKIWLNWRVHRRKSRFKKWVVAVVRLLHWQVRLLLFRKVVINQNSLLPIEFWIERQNNQKEDGKCLNCIKILS